MRVYEKYVTEIVEEVTQYILNGMQCEIEQRLLSNIQHCENSIKHHSKFSRGAKQIIKEHRKALVSHKHKLETFYALISGERRTVNGIYYYNTLADLVWIYIKDNHGQYIHKNKIESYFNIKGV